MKPKIALFQNHPACSHQCCAGMISALQSGYDIEVFTEQDDITQILTDKKIVAFPGGIGDADLYYKFFRRRNVDKIIDFVQSGGYYLGICMGAYWAGRHYFDLLDHDIDAVQYIKRPQADVRRPYSTTANITWNYQNYDMFFYDGCTYTGDSSKYITVARYANNDPMAIIQGRLGLIGCHPESEISWYAKPYLKDRWHYNQHHILLKNFVDELVNNH